MPSAPRIKNLATKIQYNILGKPANLKHKRTKREKEINKRLLFEESSRAR